MRLHRLGDSADHLDHTIHEALADARYQGHPLRELLALLWQRMAHQVDRLERITAISDRYQSSAQEQVRDLSERYERQIRMLERVIRISDRNQAALKDLNRALRESSTHDQLTGLANRRCMGERCRQEDRRVERFGGTYALLVIDADHFKTINDDFGHDVGDQALIALASAFRDAVPEGDLCARWGGEEFLALLSGADLDTAMRVAERTLAASRQIALPVKGRPVSLSVSIGIAQHQRGETYADTFRRADEALYEAKSLGRDRFALAQG